MDLATYVDDMDRRAKLAADTGSSPDYLWQIATNRRKASPKLALLIERATARKVTKESLRPDVWASRRAA